MNFNKEYKGFDDYRKLSETKIIEEGIKLLLELLPEGKRGYAELWLRSLNSLKVSPDNVNTNNYNFITGSFIQVFHKELVEGFSNYVFEDEAREHFEDIVESILDCINDFKEIGNTDIGISLHIVTSENYKQLKTNLNNLIRFLSNYSDDKFYLEESSLN